MLEETNGFCLQTDTDIGSTLWRHWVYIRARTLCPRSIDEEKSRHAGICMAVVESGVAAD